VAVCALTAFFVQVFDLRQCHDEMQRQAQMAIAEVATQQAAVQGMLVYNVMILCVRIISLYRQAAES